MLVDDHEMFRQGMRFLLTDLNDDIDFTDAGTCEEALGVLDGADVDLALLDLNMPGTDGLSALQKIHEAHPAVQIAVLSGMDDPDLIRDAIDQGASGFVPKASSSEVLVAALKLILAGGVYLPQAALNATAERPSNNDSPRTDLLSERQTDVLLKAIQGKPNKVIAREMNIAEGTVKTHLSAAFKALGVHNRTEAVFAAAKLGLKPPPPGQS
ncbi:MAG: response regulator transcription factor [Halieaceae bacterium]|nr:response regulator transcription factor [Halieaceae bacterium]